MIRKGVAGNMAAVALVLSLSWCGAGKTHEGPGAGTADGTADPQSRNDRAGDAKPGAVPAFSLPCECDDILAVEDVVQLLGLDAPLTSDGYYNSCRYRLTGEPSARALLTITCNSLYPVQRYEHQLRLAWMHARKQSGIRYEVFESDDVGAGSYEYVSLVDDKPVFMQKCFLTSDHKRLVLVQLKLRQIDARSSLFYVPDLGHLVKIAKTVEKNLKKAPCAPG